MSSGMKREPESAEHGCRCLVGDNHRNSSVEINNEHALPVVPCGPTSYETLPTATATPKDTCGAIVLDGYCCMNFNSWNEVSKGPAMSRPREASSRRPNGA